jgi:pyocin large subunit-like protein
VSFDALSWAAKCNPGSPAKKLVLLALAECAQRENNTAFPSIAAIAEFSSLNRKTIILALDQLEADGFIVDTGEKVGRTKQIKVYHLALETVPKSERSQKRNSSTFSRKESQKRDTEPVREPVKHTTRAHVIPDHWKPEPFGSKSKCAPITASWTPDELETQLEHFTAHHRGKGNRFVDWQDAWKTWVLNSRKWAPRTTGPPGQQSEPSSFLDHLVRKQAATTGHSR